MKAHGRCQILAILLLAGLPLGIAACGASKSEVQVGSLELTDVAAYWAVRGQDSEQNNYIHPVVRFRVRNSGQEPVGYIQAMAVFKRENFPDEPWGNDFLYSISEAPIAPGGSSDVVTLRSDASFIGKDAPEQMFDNPKWEEVDVEVFLRVGPSSWLPLTELEVPKRIGAPGLEKFLSSDPDAPVFPELEPGDVPPPLPRPEP